MVRKTSIFLLIIALLIVPFTGFTEVRIDPDKIYDQGIEAFENGKHVKAMKLFEEALEAGLSDSDKLKDVYQMLIILSYKTNSKSMRQTYEQKYTNISGKQFNMLTFISNLINNGKKDMAKSAMSCCLEQMDSKRAQSYATWWVIDAAGKGYEDLVKTLMKYKPELNIPTLCFPSGDLANALIAATKKGYANIVKLLLENGAIGTIYDTGRPGLSAIGYAINLKEIEILRLFDKYNAAASQHDTDDLNAAKQVANNFLSALVRNDYKSAYNQVYSPIKRDFSLDKFQTTISNFYGGGPLTKFEIIFIYLDNKNNGCDVFFIVDNQNQKIWNIPFIKYNGIWMFGRN